jgi:site-specific DNA recombinase
VVYEDKVRIPCIVSEEIWKMANERLNRRKKSFKKKSSDKEIYRNRYLYSAKIYCMVHNKSFHRREFRREKKDVTWVCSEYLKNGKKSCDTPNVREEELYYIFNDLISKLEIKLDRVVSLLMNYYKNEGRGLGIDEKIDNLRKDKEKIIDKKKKVLDLVIEGSLVKEEFKEKNNELSLEMENIDKKIEVLIEDKNKDSGKNLECLEEYITKLVNSRVIKERVIGKIIDRIGVFKVNDDNRNIGLNVFLDYNGKGKLLGESNYEFKRGYDTRGTKRYVVNYWVKYYVGG